MKFFVKPSITVLLLFGRVFSLTAEGNQESGSASGEIIEEIVIKLGHIADPSHPYA